MMRYNKESLHQCVRDLFDKARFELRKKKHLPVSDLVISRWEESEEPFSATGFKLWKTEDSKIIVELAVYCEDYKATVVVGKLEHAHDIFGWLDMLMPEDQSHEYVVVEKKKRNGRKVKK